jgi:hypothetical protein
MTIIRHAERESAPLPECAHSRTGSVVSFNYSAAQTQSQSRAGIVSSTPLARTFERA